MKSSSYSSEKPKYYEVKNMFRNLPTHDLLFQTISECVDDFV